MVEGIWPELDIKVCAKEECSGTIGKGSVPLFDWPILMGVVGTSRVDGVPFLFEKIPNLWMIEEFATLIKNYIFVAAIGVVLRKEEF